MIFGTQKAVISLREDFGELKLRVRELESANKHLSLEWEELYDKVRRQMARMSKRYAVDHKEELDETGPGPAPDDGPRVDSISRGILQRRAGNGVSK